MALKYIRERINDTWGTRRWGGPQHGLLAAHVQPRFGAKPDSATGGHLIYGTETASCRWSPPTVFSSTIRDQERRVVLVPITPGTERAFAPQHGQVVGTRQPSQLHHRHPHAVLTAGIA
jgi:hypothetical protein